MRLVWQAAHRWTIVRIIACKFEKPMVAYLKKEHNIIGEIQQIRPEIELLLCCARIYIDPITAKRIKALVKEDLKWDYLIQTAASHNVIPLLYQSLNKICPEAVAKITLNQLRNKFLVNYAHNICLAKELLKLLNLLKKYGIPAIPFKGPVLAASVYSNLALREFCDLDILVREQDFLQAIEILSQNEYQPTDKRWLLSDTQYAASQLYSNEYSLVSHDGEIHLDLHHRIIAKQYFSVEIDFEYWWQRLEPVSMLNTTVLNFQPEDLLLILCVHGSKHLWSRLGWLCDIAELIRLYQEIDWVKLMEKSRSWGCERMLLLSLFLANNLLGVELPLIVHQRIQADPESQSLAKQVLNQLFYNPNGEIEGLVNNKLIFNFRMIERPQDKIRYCVHYLFWRWGWLSIWRLITPTFQDRDFFPLHNNFYFLYYLIRPVRLVRNLGLMMWQFLRGDYSNSDEEKTQHH